METFSIFERGQKREYGLFVGDNKTCMDAARDLSFTPVSLEALAMQRMELGLFHQSSWTGSRTTASLIVKGADFYLTVDPDFSPLYFIGSHEWHRQQREIPLPTGEPNVISIDNESFDLSTKELGYSEIGAFLFGEAAQEYGEWLYFAGIEYLPIHLPPVSLTRQVERPFIRPIVMRCTDNWSGLISQNDLHNPYGTRTWRQKNSGAEVDFQDEEIFSSEALSQIARFYGLENRSYSFRELQSIAEELNLMDIFGLSLRIIRGGNILPASYDTFKPSGKILP